MTLQRRARLARKTRMRRTPIKPAARRLAHPPRDTGPTRVTRQLVWTRADGACELCGRDLDGRPSTAYSLHHRLPRRMGGTRRPWVNAASNLLLVCGSGTTGCHHLIESQRASAYGYGWLLRDTQHPLEEPVVLGAPAWPDRTRFVWLTDTGTYADRPDA